MLKLLGFLKKYIRFFCLIALLLILMVCLFGNYEWNYDEEEIKLKEPDEDLEINEQEDVREESVEKVYVDIKGEVKNPGIYEVPIDKRIFDVIELAGGVTARADTSVNNLSMKVKDEMVIIIYSKEEVANFSKTKEIQEVIQEKCSASNGMINDSCIDSDITSYPISVNDATLEQLISVPGLGEVKAKKIIEYRNENGDFKNLDDLKKVSGIGDSTFEKIKEYFKL